MNCAEARQLLHGYADGELDLVRSLEVEEHLRECSGCAEALGQQQALRSALRQEALYHRAPAHLAGRLRATLRQLVEGVHALHGAGKLHRDIKPSNVLVTPEGRVVLLDFGVARTRERSARTRHRTGRGAILGTPSTMSPEQALGEEVDPRADVWALACCAYEASTGRPVVDARNLATVFARLCTFDILPLRADRPTLPPALEEVCFELIEGLRRWHRVRRLILGRGLHV